MEQDLYHILGVEPDADSEGIRQAYRREAKRSHPDASGNCRSAGRFRAVEEAYQTLRDPQRRRAYDRRLGGAGRVSAERGEPVPVRVREPAPGGEAFAAAGLAPWRRGGEALLEVLLSLEEALRGAVIPLRLPLRRPCPDCGDLPQWARWGCPTCGGRGTVRSECRLDLQIPAGLRDGGEFRCELRGAFGEPVTDFQGFRVRIAVRPG